MNFVHPLRSPRRGAEAPAVRDAARRKRGEQRSKQAAAQGATIANLTEAKLEHRFKPCCDHHKPLKTLRFRGFFIFRGSRYVHFGESKMSGIHHAVHIEKQMNSERYILLPCPEGCSKSGVFTVLHNKAPAS